ncbi:cyclin-dependent protein kinase inhibitor [Hygrophoropsis aurantiaca]|uniref:Cyclin-dependent protein kinase inhibitor n=1 Tax=Hygrophoropsis aurantiaca TaxID=72124 RepID=A0ACB8AWK1_9AGAM|nr:cyclin-dependent protein kinase inhibitor [Hygrophoropsis aurantiaca]
MEFFNDIGQDPLKPSLFELVAQEQLRDLLQPALKYILAVFAQRYPRYLIRIVNRHEEFYAFLMLFVERYYLRKHNASFSENFYGLKRRRRPWIETERTSAAVGGIPAGEKLQNSEVWRSLLFLVGLPYLRVKARDYYESLGGGIDLDILEGEEGRRPIHALTEESLAGRLRRAYKQLYPWLNISFEVWLLAHNVAYLFDRSPFYRPWLAWTGVDLRRLSMDDFRLANLGQRVSPERKRTIIASIRRLILSSPRLLLDSLRLLLPTAIFFVKFLEWWYSPGSPARSLSTSPLGPAVPPPQLLPPHPSGLYVDGTKYGHCPLCNNLINNATALPSGYVFCYRCAYDHVEQHGKCPVTLLPAKVWQLRKFGKQIQSEQVPGWSVYYLDYKFLKKIISSLSANRPASEAAALALGIRPGDVLGTSGGSHTLLAEIREDIGQPPILSALRQDDDRGPDFQAHKAAFFFKLERELEKINAFYLRKEAELKLRLETLLSKRRAAALRGLPDTMDDNAFNHVEWNAVEEGFRLLERDLGKLQQFIEMNATGFRKILKKWDKRSRSTTKELYLARQVEVQPVFNRQLISELSDIVASCLLDLTDLSLGLKVEGSTGPDALNLQLNLERNNMYSGPYFDFESDLRKAVENSDGTSIKDLIEHSTVLAQQNEGRINVNRILWKAIVSAPPALADLILNSVVTPFDFEFVDDINGRTCLHEAAAAGTLRLVDICLDNASQQDKLDVYGRSPLHYAAMHGHANICKRLLGAQSVAHALDMDNCSPLIYATLRGSTECVEVLLSDSTVSLQSTATTGDIVPLSLASQCGHLEVVSLLLKHGAGCFPNSNGEYPIHLAAREGHADVCNLLITHDGWDTPDKYHEWTPLFHAARYGRSLCIEVLLQAGSQVDKIDELGHRAIHYAAWYGHHDCVARLIQIETGLPFTLASRAIKGSPSSDIEVEEGSEIDMIPSLSLPPPIMPHRMYGHNYLDKHCLVEVIIGNLPSRHSAIKLQPRLSSSISFQNPHLPSSSPLKMVLTAGPGANGSSYSISLPQKNMQDVFVFQVPSLSTLSLEFSIYPNFGTKTIGRAVAHPSLFTSLVDGSAFTLPILDNRLHTIGEISFCIAIITPFQGVTLEVGGAVETYWKSMSLPKNILPNLQTSMSWQQSPRSLDSTHTSPSMQSTAVLPTHSQTISSLTGTYVYATIQVTRDFHPVVCCEWLLPDTGFELGVADVTLAQFEHLSERLRRDAQLIRNVAASDWPKFLPQLMLSLAHLMKLLPVHLGLTLNLVCPTQGLSRRQLDLNQSTDAVLRTLHHVSASLGGPYARRRIAFSSYSPRVCAALNWKQPNYPVFFSSHCGLVSQRSLNPTAVGAEEQVNESGYWASSVSAGVEFAKMNNLLGVFFDGELLLRVPSLVQGIRDAGLLIGVYGNSQTQNNLAVSATFEDNHIDAYIKDGTIVYMDRSAEQI